MPRRGYQEQAVGTGMASFAAGAPPAIPTQQPLDYSSIQRALQGFTELSLRRDEERAVQQATQLQQAMGVGQVAEPQGYMLPRVRRVFEERAEKVYMQQLGIDALRMDTQLRQRHRNDPAGYQVAWDTYAQESVKGLEESNPRLATAAQAMLAETGARSWSAVSDQAFRHELALQEGETIRNFQQFRDVSRDRLLDPSVSSDQRDFDYEEAVTAGMAFLQEAVTDGRITPEVFNREMEKFEDDTRSEWVRGNVTAALNAGRHTDALGYIEALRQGQWFTNNNKARALANTLETDVRRALSGESDFMRQMRDNARAEASMMLSGVEPPEQAAGAIAKYKDYAARSGSQEMLDDAVGLELGLFAQNLIQNIDVLGVQALEGMDSLFAQVQLDERVRNALIDARNTRLEQINTAVALNDPYALRDLYPNLNREQTAAAANVDVNSLPILTRGQVASALQYGKNTGDVDGALQPLFNEAFEYGGGAADIAYSAIAAAEAGLISDAEASAMSLAAVSWASGNPNLANRAFMDGDFTAADPAIAGLRFTEDFKSETRVFQTISAMAGHDPVVRTQMRNALNNMYRAEAARLEDVSAVVAGASDIAELLNNEFDQIAITEIGGRSYPLSWFGTPEVGQEREARARGLNRRVTELQDEFGMALRVVPTGDGTFDIYAGESRNIFVENYVEPQQEDRRSQVEIMVAQMQDAAIEESQDPAWLREVADTNPLVTTQFARQQFDTRINRAARASGVSQENMRRLAAASLQSSAEERASRFGPLAMNVFPDRDPFSPDQEPVNEGDAARHFGELLRRYDNDPAKALAAYWSDPGQVDFFVDAYGEQWVDYMPGEVREFVYRGMQADVETVNFVHPDMPLSWDSPLWRTPLQ